MEHDPQTGLDLISTSAQLLFVNGQSTERTVLAVERFAHTMGIRATLFPRWDELTLQIEDDSGFHSEIIAASPVGVDMHKVIAYIACVSTSAHDVPAAVRKSVKAPYPLDLSACVCSILFLAVSWGRCWPATRVSNTAVSRRESKKA